MNHPAISVYTRPRSKWWWCSICENGKRHRISCRFLGLSCDTHTAEQARAAIIHHYTDNTGVMHTINWLYNTINDRLTREGLRETTIKRYRESLSHLRNMLGYDFPLNEIKRRPHLDQFKQHLLSLGGSPHTVNTHCRGIQAILSRMVDSGIIENNPFDRFRRVATPEPDMTAFTPDEIDRVFETMKASYRPENMRIVRILYHTGRRTSEILELTHDDVRIDDGIFSPMNIKRHDRRKRWLEIPTEVKNDFAYFIAKKESKPFRVCRESGSLGEWFRRWCDKAGIPPEKKLKHLRNTFVSEGLEADNAWAVKEYLDHSTIKLTESYYRRRLKITRRVNRV